MTEEETLAIVLVAASGFLLIMIIITLCVIFYCVDKKRKPHQSQIPMSKTNYHSYNNYALDREGIYTTPTAKTESAQPEHEPPAKYDMYSMSHSQALQEKGESSSNHDNHSQPSTGQNSDNHDNYSRPSSGISTISREISHKTFSEEVFDRIKDVNPEARKSATPQPKNEETGSQTSGIWKYNPPELHTGSQHSGDQHSTGTNSTASYQQSLSTKQPSYYSTFKSHTVYVSKSDGSSSANNPQAIIEASQRQKLTTERVETSGNRKVFTFNIQ